MYDAIPSQRLDASGDGRLAHAERLCNLSDSEWAGMVYGREYGVLVCHDRIASGVDKMLDIGLQVVAYALESCRETQVMKLSDDIHGVSSVNNMHCYITCYIHRQVAMEESLHKRSVSRHSFVGSDRPILAFCNA